MRILTRYVLKEMLGPLFFGIFTFASMFLGVALINLMGLMERYQVSFWAVLKILVLRLPQDAMYGTAMAVLLAVLLGLGKLTSHSETIAMRAGGLSYFRLAVISLTIGLIVSVSGVLLNEYVIPESLRAQERLKNQIISNSDSLVLTDFYRVFSYKGVSKAVFAGKYYAKTRKLENVVILEIVQGKLSRTIQTKSMVWKAGNWYFNKVKLYQYQKDYFFPTEIAEARFNYNLGLTPQDIELSNEPPERKSISELAHYIDKYVSDAAEKRRLLTEMHSKIAIPFASLIFALLGTPLALKPQRRSSASGFGLCMLFILIWYLIYAFGYNFGRNGTLDPFIGAWSANICLFGYGLYVFSKVKS